MSPTLRGLRNGVTSLCFVTMLLLLVALPTSAASSPEADGAEIFQQKCAGCHTIGGGPQAGPDLEGVTGQRDPDWLARFISEPDMVLAEGDPIATALLQEYNNLPMPAMGLSPDQVQAVIAYLAAESGSSAAPAGQGSAIPPAIGDPDRGEALFAGTAHLGNRGTPCLGCHSAGDTGWLGGGVLGPDLTQVADRYGTGLQAALASIPWPTMSPIYTRHPLTPQEQADLAAFLQSLSGQQPVDLEWVVVALSLLGLAAACAAIAFVWRRRLRGVRRQMVEQSRIR